MSKGAVTKSRTEKKGGQSVPTPAITHEIIPGKYTDQDWNYMLEKDDGEEFIADLVEDILGLTMKSAYDRYISRQLLPFTINQAKDAILQIIEWQFLACDKGESNVEQDPGWIQDEEPDPATTDCWAQGSVPKIFLPPPTPTVEELPAPEEELKPIEEVEEAPEDGIEDKVSDTPLSEQEAQEELLAAEEVAAAAAPVEVKESKPPKKKKGYKPHFGRLKSAGVSRMTESLEDTEIQLWEKEARENMSPEKQMDLSLIQMPISCHSLLRMQQGRPPGNKDVVYDEMGNVVAVVKLNPDRLPNHRVKVGYHIVDPTVEAAEARLDAMKKGKLRKTVLAKDIKHVNGKRQSITSAATTSTNKHSVLTESLSKTPLPPAMIDTIDIAPGVMIREGQQVRKGPRRLVKRSNQLTEETQHMLKPINICSNLPTLDVDEILERRTPIVKPIRESPPIPPINPRPPQQPQVS